MMTHKPNEKALGMVGLGVMGRNLLLNLADAGYAVAGYDRSDMQTAALASEGSGKPVEAAGNLSELIASLSRPRVVMLLVPAGPAVDAVINELLPLLSRGDIVIDGGNSHYRDTDQRAARLQQHHVAYLGVGISGGEYGARHGPSIMPGGDRRAYEQTAAMFHAAAAQVDGQPCVAYLGPGSAGHYVKMVHNGIEYGLMQLIAESYDLLRRGLGLDNLQIAEAFEQWNNGALSGYLIEITSRIFRQVDRQTHRPLIDLIRDEARQKGTGMWTSRDAMELQVPVPTIDAAVAMRNMSALKQQRQQASRIAPQQAGLLGTGLLAFEEQTTELEAFLAQLGDALYASMIVTYAQGFALLLRASEAYRYQLNLADVARIWRGGCIIRATLLDDILATYERYAGLPNLLLDSTLASHLMALERSWRSTVAAALQAALPVPAMAASLSYYDAYRSLWLPANLIQAQRDYFGAHQFERVDAEGSFHVEWTGPLATSTAPVSATTRANR